MNKKRWVFLLKTFDYGILGIQSFTYEEYLSNNIGVKQILDTSAIRSLSGAELKNCQNETFSEITTGVHKELTTGTAEKSHRGAYEFCNAKQQIIEELERESTESVCVQHAGDDTDFSSTIMAINDSGAVQAKDLDILANAMYFGHDCLYIKESSIIKTIVRANNIIKEQIEKYEKPIR